MFLLLPTNFCKMNKDYNLPHVVVIGNQSVGKSSIISALCGYDMSPCGPGVVTRHPFIIDVIGTKDIG